MTNSKRAGIETARVDFRRGMDREAMEKVPQHDDCHDWAQGYRDETEYLWLQELLWSDE